MIEVTDIKGLEAVNRLLDSSIGKAMFPGIESFDVIGLDELGWKFYLCEGAGLFIAEPLPLEGAYRGHSGFLPHKQGCSAVVEHRRILEHFFTHTDATRLICSVNSERAERNVQGLGFTVQKGLVSVAQLDSLTWAAKSRACRDAGLVLRKLFPEAHLDVTHHFGAFLLMTRAGRLNKGFSHLNTFCQLTGIEGIWLNGHNAKGFIFCGKSFEITDNDIVEV